MRMADVRRNREARLRNRAHRPDYSIALITYGLLLWGLVIFFSLSPYLGHSSDISLGKQLLIVAIGTMAFIIAGRIPIAKWRRYQSLIIAIAVVATLMLLLPGDLISEVSHGARRWLSYGWLSFQPSELVKLALILYFAHFLSRRAKQGTVNDPKATIIPMAVIIIVSAIFIAVIQRDLGTMIVVATITLAMLYVAGLSFRNLLYIILAGLIAMTMLIAIAPHRLTRISGYLDPTSDPFGSGYHIQQAGIAIGSGGLYGLGIGHSIQAFGYLPETANDSIFAIHAETIGFLGILLLLAVFAWLLRRIQVQAVAAVNEYDRLIVVGVFSWLASHLIINISAMLGLLPLTGITLPLLSYGGSSMVLTMFSLGIVFQISRYSDLSIIHGRNRRIAMRPVARL